MTGVSKDEKCCCIAILVENPQIFSGFCYLIDLNPASLYTIWLILSEIKWLLIERVWSFQSQESKVESTKNAQSKYLFYLQRKYRLFVGRFFWSFQIDSKV